MVRLYFLTTYISPEFLRIFTGNDEERHTVLWIPVLAWIRLVSILYRSWNPDNSLVWLPTRW